MLRIAVSRLPSGHVVYHDWAFYTSDLGKEVYSYILYGNWYEEQYCNKPMIKAQCCILPETFEEYARKMEVWNNRERGLFDYD